MKIKKSTAAIICAVFASIIIVTAILAVRPADNHNPLPETSPSPAVTNKNADIDEIDDIDIPDIKPIDEKPESSGGDIHVGAGGKTPKSGSAKPEKIALNKNELTITKGNTYKLRVSFTPESAAQDITWSSGNTKSAAISKDGIITGAKAGTAIITAKTPNGKTDQCTVIIKDPSKQ